MTKLNPPKNYREVEFDSCDNCEYIKGNNTTNVYGLYTFSCMRGRPKGWENIEIDIHICDGHKRADDKENM
jgi:hypothetical protein